MFGDLIISLYFSFLIIFILLFPLIIYRNLLHFSNSKEHYFFKNKKIFVLLNFLPVIAKL